MIDQIKETDSPGRDGPRCEQRFVRRGPVESTTGLVRVKVIVQQETDDVWYARVPSLSSFSHVGRTRKEAVREALKGACDR